MNLLRALILQITTLCVTVTAGNFVPFVIPFEQNPESEIIYKYQPLTKNSKLTVAGEHFVDRNGVKVRIWGVNMSFAACFPEHKDAEVLAKRLAGAGVNSVRFHHMDSANWPRGIWDSSGMKLHPEALDRLDYFIDQLAQCGIYANINLHVGKEYSANLDIPHPQEHELRYDKMISIFTPEIIEAHKKYAYSLLNHTNKYRQMRYADDFAVGFVEITNENSLFMWSAASTLPELPEYYANVLQKQYNKWLTKKYGNDEKLTNAWLSENEPLGKNMIINSQLDVNDNGQINNWSLEQHGQAKVKLQTITWKNKQCLNLKPENIDDINWHLQLNYRNLKIVDGQSYTVSFYAAAPKQRELYLYVNQNHADWKNLGLYKTVRINNNWKKYEINFVANQSDNNGRVGVSFGLDGTEFYLADFQMFTGVQYRMNNNESLAKADIKVFGEIESPTRKADRMMFLAETEKAYFDGMYKYIKYELGCTANITGTIVFGPLGLWTQSDMDYIDSHAYWKHPQFPGKPWDPGNWKVEQEAMSAHPSGSTLIELASERLAGKPFTVSEYNHPAPLDSQAECVPMIASWAARQDWNGVWLYTYSHSNNQWDRNYLNSYFDIDSNPAKWGFMRAGAAAFRQEGIAETSSPRKFKLSQMGLPVLDKLAMAHIKYDRNMKALFNDNLMGNHDDRFIWQNGLYITLSNSCGAIAGKMKNLTTTLDRDMGLEINIKTPETAAIMLAPINNNSNLLIAACGKCENTDMKFSVNRETVGRNWGHGPVKIETVEGTIALLDNDTTNYKCYALKPDGAISEEVPIENNKIVLSPKYKTMWYLLSKE